MEAFFRKVKVDTMHGTRKNERTSDSGVTSQEVQSLDVKPEHSESAEPDPLLNEKLARFLSGLGSMLRKPSSKQRRRSVSAGKPRFG